MGPRRVATAVRWRARRHWAASRNRLLGVRATLPAPSASLAAAASLASGAGSSSGWGARSGGAGPVALTFDDGPDPHFTPAVLDTLQSLGVTATFFCVGDRAAEQPHLVRRILDEGHALGVHCGTHQDLWTLGAGQVAEDIRRGRRVLEGIAGHPLTLFRPAKGHLDVRVGVAARRLGLRTWLWNVDPEDWRPGAASADIVAGAASAGPGDVILLHDGLEQPWAPEALDRGATVAALGPLVEALRERRLDFVGLPS